MDDWLDMTEEIWRIVPSLNGLYEASSQGRIRKTTASPNGYYPVGHVLSNHLLGRNGFGVSLTVNGQRKGKTVARLIAEAFHGLPLPDREVNHKNGNRLDNRPENLEWVTASENVLHAYRVLHRPLPPLALLKGSQCYNAKLTEEIVAVIRAEIAAGPRGTSAAMARKYGVDKATISVIKQGKGWPDVQPAILG